MKLMSAQNATVCRPVQRRALRVLLVQTGGKDAARTRELLSGCATHTFRVDTADNVASAIRCGLETAYDLAVLDLDSGGGLADLRSLRAACPDLPVVVLAATDDRALDALA